MLTCLVTTIDCMHVGGRWHVDGEEPRGSAFVATAQRS